MHTLGDTTSQRGVTPDIDLSNNTAGPEAYEYWAFISYSHRDEGWAAWLHKQIEIFRGHKKLVGTQNRSGESIPTRIFPVFRDRDEMSAAPDYEERIQRALRESRLLVVICSPAAAHSQHVDAEIRYFKSLGREDKVLALIVAGEPHAVEGSTESQIECFPEAVKYKVDPSGNLTTLKVEPLAADLREGKDGKRKALLKIIAEVLEVGFDDLRRRDQERRLRFMMTLGSSALIALLIVSVLAAWAWVQRNEAVAQRKEAEIQRSRAEEQQREAKQQKVNAELNAKMAVEQRRIAEANEKEAKQQQQLALTRLAEAQRSESNRLIATANKLIEDGDATTAALVVLEALPRNLNQPERPLLSDAISTLDRAFSHNREIARWRFQDQDTHCARFVTDERLLVVTRTKDTWRNHEVTTQSASVHSRLLWDKPTTSVRTTPDCRWIIAVDAGGTAAVLDTSGSTPARQIAVMPIKYTSAGIDNAGRQLALSGTDGVIYVWKVDTENQPLRLSGHKRENSQLVFSPDGQRLASAGYDSTARIWWLAENHDPIVIEADEHVLSVGWSEDGNVLHVGSYTGIASSHDANSGTLLDQRPYLGEKIRAIAPGVGNASAVGFDSGRIIVWSPKWHYPNISLHSPGVLEHLSSNANGSRLVATQRGGIVYVIDISYEKNKEIESSEVMRLFSEFGSKEREIPWSPEVARGLAKRIRLTCAELHRDLSGPERRALLNDLAADLEADGILSYGALPKACALTIWPTDSSHAAKHDSSSRDRSR